MKYTLTDIKGRLYQHTRRFTCTILEDGIAIATVVRKANTFYYGDMKIKFLTEGAQRRFCDFSNAISMVECVEALLGEQP